MPTIKNKGPPVPGHVDDVGGDKPSERITSENFVVLCAIAASVIVVVVAGVTGELHFLIETAQTCFLAVVDAVKTTVLGGFYTIYQSFQNALQTVYRDVSMEKIVVFMAVTVLVRQFPWMMEMAVKLLSKSPRT